MNFKNIKSFEDACKACGLDPNALPDVSMLPERHRKHIIADIKLCIIAEAINAGWKPDYIDINQYKYFPYFGVSADAEHPSGFGFSRTDYGRWHTRTGVGSRLCFKSSEMALYAAKQFKDLYVDYLLIPQ